MPGATGSTNPAAFCLVPLPLKSLKAVPEIWAFVTNVSPANRNMISNFCFILLDFFYKKIEVLRNGLSARFIALNIINFLIAK
jgi:hypothetical protein